MWHRKFLFLFILVLYWISGKENGRSKLIIAVGVISKLKYDMYLTYSDKLEPKIVCNLLVFTVNAQLQIFYFEFYNVHYPYVTISASIYVEQHNFLKSINFAV